MSKSVAVSVVMPCYRAAATVAAAVESVRAQTALPLELIAVDDASEDATPEVLAQLQRTSGKDWMKVIRLASNRGAASARNIAWNQARGDWIAFLDADDTWHPRKIELQHAFMAAHPEIAICGHRSTQSSRAAPFDEVTAPKASYPSPVSFLLRNQFITPSVMLRRDLPQRFVDGRRYMEDHLLWTTIVLAGARAAILEVPLASIHKASYGEAGLSAHLWEMEKGELDNYRQLRRAGLISAAATAGLQLYSLAKFAKRLVVVKLRRG